MKALAEFLYVRGIQLSFAGKHFGDDAFSAEVGGEVALLQAVLVEEKAEACGTV